jgi:hypothetical protein
LFVGLFFDSTHTHTLAALLNREHGSRASML